MPTSIDRAQLLEKGIIDEGNRYNRYDTLAKADDLEELFEVLSRYIGGDGNPAVMTPVTITGNPDFEKIKEENFEKYYAEPFPETLKRYYGENNNIMETWKQGMKAGVFKPQFHGREHLNVAEWMRSLQNSDKTNCIAFDHGFWGLRLGDGDNTRISSFQAAFDLYDPKDLQVQEQSIIEGLHMFETIFGYRAIFFVPPNGPFNNSLEKTAYEYGIKYISKAKRQIEPLGWGETRTVFHIPGRQNEHGQLILTRNCVFEPSEEGKDWVSSCLSDIKIAFRMRKPAVISTHRVNYIGALEESNRKRGLKQLDELLSAIMKNWPDVEFITSDQLGDIIAGEKKMSK
ncbi:hypothetical protein [Rhodohalobacter barkolensis]|nr:hypothetical protein [Rhodohalobacter barkolensis]